MRLGKLVGLVFLLVGEDPRRSLAGRQMETLEPLEKAVRQGSRVSGKVEQQRHHPRDRRSLFVSMALLLPHRQHQVLVVVSWQQRGIHADWR